MKNLEEKIAEMQKQLDELKKQVKPTFEVGKWYVSVSNNERKICITEYLGKEQAHGYGFDYCGDWFNNLKNTWYISDMQPATDKEVEKALIKEAIKRGFKEGIIFNSPNAERDFSFNQKLISNKFWLTGNTLSSSSDKNNGGCNIFKDGKWAEIIKDEPIKIGGYEVIVTENDGFKIGCKNICRTEIEKVRSFMVNHGFKLVSFDGIEVTLETINKVLSL